jgi:hypothetical protein
LRSGGVYRVQIVSGRRIDVAAGALEAGEIGTLEPAYGAAKSNMRPQSGIVNDIDLTFIIGVALLVAPEIS